MENQTNNNQSKKERDAQIIKDEIVKKYQDGRFDSEVSWRLFRDNLYLSNKGLKDISKIGGLTKIEELYLDNNEIEDICSLAHLINLTQLDLSHNKINDIEALEKLIELKALDLSYNEISDISPLFKLGGFNS